VGVLDSAAAARQRLNTTLLVLVVAGVAVLLGYPLAADAAYPGPNGKIQFTRGSAATDDEIDTMIPTVRIRSTSPRFRSSTMRMDSSRLTACESSL
jgi:hypothetical protein